MSKILNELILLRDAEIAQLRAQLAERDAEIAQLRRRIDAQEITIAQQAAHMATDADTIKRLENDATAYRAEIEVDNQYRVSENKPDSDRAIIAYCKDGEYRTMRYSASDARWYGSISPWEMHGNESPVYWWELPEVTHD